MDVGMSGLGAYIGPGMMELWIFYPQGSTFVRTVLSMY